MIKGQKKLGEILIDRGKITPEQLEAALKEQTRTKEYLGKVLLKMRLITEQDLLATLSEQFGITLVNLKDKYIDWNLVKGFSSSLIFDFRCFPIKKDDWAVTVAITNPLDVWALKKAEEETKGLKLKLVLVSDKDMDEVIARYRQYMKENISSRFK